MNRPLIIALALCALAHLSGCASPAQSDAVTLPKVPAWRTATDARTFSSAEVGLSVAEIAPRAALDIADSSFVPVSHEWLEQAVVWARDAAWRTDLNTYVPEAWDCDDFASAFALVAKISAKRANVRAQPLLARIYVVQEKAFGNVPAGGRHALCAFLSDRGLFVLEPQSFALVPLAQYPNRHAITDVKIGG